MSFTYITAMSSVDRLELPCTSNSTDFERRWYLIAVIKAQRRNLASFHSSAVTTFVVAAWRYCFAKFVHAIMAATRPNWLVASQIAVMRPVEALAAAEIRYAATTCSIVDSEAG